MPFLLIWGINGFDRIQSPQGKVREEGSNPSCSISSHCLTGFFSGVFVSRVIVLQNSSYFPVGLFPLLPTGIFFPLPFTSLPLSMRSAAASKNMRFLMKKLLTILLLSLNLFSLCATTYTASLRLVANVKPRAFVSEKGEVLYSGEANVSVSLYQEYGVINISAL